MEKYNELFEQLNAKTKTERLEAVKGLKQLVDEGKLNVPAAQGDTNNHIHTIYSFSPYSPSKAVWRAYEAGLETAGIIDHDSVAGVDEFLQAAAVLNMPAATGFEVRADMKGTKFETYKLNNPDQAGNAYITLHGLPHDKLGYINEKLAPYRKARVERTRKMADGISELLKKYGISYDFEKDVLALTQYSEGGTITERYLLYALAKILMENIGVGQKLIDYIQNELNIQVPAGITEKLQDEQNPHYIYDLLGLFKADFLNKVYILGADDCPPVQAMLDLANETGCIAAYCYLGDQGLSVTGDKKAAKYEDDYLEEVCQIAKEMGFKAMAYMPSRNTDEQIIRLKELCKKYDLFEVCGEDINTPRQKFICEKMRQPLFADAYDCTYALIGHELEISAGRPGLFSDESESLERRIQIFKQIGLRAYGK